MYIHTVEFPSVELTSDATIQDVKDTTLVTFPAKVRDEHMTFHVWGKYGEAIRSCLKKGRKVSILGRMVPKRSPDPSVFVVDIVGMHSMPKVTLLKKLSMFKDGLISRVKNLRPTPIVDDTPTEKPLVDMILDWWEDVKYESVEVGDGEWDNLYDEEPDFVSAARKIKEEVTT